MKFCTACESRMDKEAAIDSIGFKCRTCGFKTPGKNEDTLMFEEYIETAETNNTKYDDFIKASAHDTAGYKVKRQCSNCKSPFMTLLRVGERQATLYTCTCGNKVSYSD